MHHADGNTGTTSKHTSPGNDWFRERIWAWFVWA